MHKCLYFLIILLTVSLAYSQTYYMNVNLSNGTTVIYEVADISKIDFSDIPSGLHDTKKLAQIVKSLKLLQNYPNPFNPFTTIEFELPKNGKVEVCIYDMLGRLVKTLVNGEMQTGTHSITWNGLNESGSKVASGMYTYTIKFDEAVLSKKMILVK